MAKSLAAAKTIVYVGTTRKTLHEVLDVHQHPEI